MKKNATGRAGGRGGFAIVEAVMAILIVALVLLAALQAASASNLAQYKAGERAAGYALAHGLLAEIIPLAYVDPGSAPLFGRESGESASSRSSYDDVDDFNGWSETPPVDKDNNVLPGLTGWSRSVVVEWVMPGNLTQTSATETGLKRITVQVKHNNIPVATAVAIRSNAP